MSSFDEMYAGLMENAQQAWDEGSTGGDVMPEENGNYTALGKSIDCRPTGVDERTGKQKYAIELQFVGTAGSWDGKPMTRVVFTANKSAMGELKVLATLLNGGRLPEKVEEGLKVLEQKFPNTPINFDLKRTISKKGTPFVNLTYKSVG